MKISSIPKSGRKGSVVYLNTRYGKVAHQYVTPRNPQSDDQQCSRRNFGAVSGRWRILTAEQRAAWRTASANRYFITESGRQVRLNCYHFFVSINTRRAELGLPHFDLPPAEPVFNPNPVAELVITNTGGKITLKLRVPSPPAQYTLVQGPGPDWRPLCAALPFSGAAATPDRRLERHHRALCCPVWRTESRHGHLDSHLPAH